MEDTTKATGGNMIIRNIKNTGNNTFTIITDDLEINAVIMHTFHDGQIFSHWKSGTMYWAVRGKYPGIGLTLEQALESSESE